MGTAERRLREKKQRVEDILDAAEQVFFSKGFDSSTMDDVADEAEFSKGALYNYFKSKNELCVGIVSRALGIICKEFEKVLENKEAKGIELLENAGRNFLSYYEQYPNYYCALLNYKNHRVGCGSDSEVLQLATEENEKINNLFRAMLEKGMEDGSVRRDIDPEMVAATLWGDVSGLILGFILAPEDPKSPELFSQAMEIVVNGLKP